MLNDVLFNPNSVEILHKIMVRQGRMSRADFRDLGAIVIKAFGRGQGFATEKERKEGDQMLAFRSKMEITDKMLQKATGILLGILPTEVPRPSCNPNITALTFEAVAFIKFAVALT